MKKKTQDEENHEHIVFIYLFFLEKKELNRRAQAENNKKVNLK